MRVDDGSRLGEGNRAGRVDVPVRVRYGDGREDDVRVGVRRNEQADNDG
ncbi:hypothetical protein [Staphylococcus hominis]|nr:hypothetical protein [Staphylococcus hominis]